MDFTSRLALAKPNPDPVTGDVVDVAILNQNADKIDGAISATPCTSGTRPATPFQGQIIVESDTKKMYVWVGSWLPIATMDAWNLTVENSIFLGGQIEVNRPAPRVAVDHAFRSKLVADSQYRFLVQVDGRMLWSDGTNGADTNLYRSASDTLRTDDTFQANRFIAVATTSTFPPPGLTALTLTGGWVNYGSGFESASFFKDATGVVHVTGLIKSGTISSGTVLATLPAGFRPANQEIFCCVSNDSAHAHNVRIDVKPTGAIEIGGPGASTGYTSLAGISFRAAN